MRYTVREIAHAIDAEATGDLDLTILKLSEPFAAGPNDLAVAINPKYAEKLNLGRARAAILWADADWYSFGLAAAILPKNPRFTMAKLTEIMDLKQGFEDRINHLVYPVPDAQFPFLGVHFTRMIDGTREVGPNAVLALKRDGYSKSSFSLKDSYESLTYPGLLRFIGDNFSFSINEFKSSLFKKDFISKAQKMIPDVDASMLETGPSGVRAQAISREGKLQMDFNIIRTGRQIHVLNAPSPGATASLAIASHIIENYLYKH